MDGEAFFDRLYSFYSVNFPCFAVALADGQGFATEPADDGSESLIILTDEDLVERYLARPACARAFPVRLGTPDLLARLLGSLPPSISHIAFDPNLRFHRRYSIEVIRAGLSPTLKQAG